MKIINYVSIILLAASITSCKKDNSEAPSPFIGITIDNPFKTQPDTVTFIATSTIPSSYSWNFGDGSTEASGETVTHIFDIGYYYVRLNAVTDANQSATLYKGINTSRFRRAVINNVKFTQLPATRTDGSAWDTDGTGPDVYCRIITGIRTGTTATLNNVNLTTSGTVNINFFPAFSDSLFDQPLILEIYNSNISPFEDDLMETVTLDKNLIDLIKNQEPYDIVKPFQTTSVIGQLGLYWAQ